MEHPARAIEQEELLAQMGWVAALARSLVRDPNVAADVAQQTWLTALERPPHTARSGPGLRAWLATVTRTLARQSVRSETRRTAREKRAAQAEAQPSAVDIVGRGEMQKKLVDTVLELDEPYRSTVLYRYLDGLSAPEIAERMEVSPAAVRKRISRGLEHLRGRLDQAHGNDRNKWMLAMLPLARLPHGLGSAETPTGWGPASPTLPPPSALTGLGTLTLGSKLTVVASLIAIGALLVVMWPETAAPEQTPRPEATRTVDPATSLPVASSAGADEAAPLPLVPSPIGTPFDPLDTLSENAGWAPLRGALEGRVVDIDGQPVQDVRVRFEPFFVPTGADAQGRASPTAVSGMGGRFRIEGIDSRGQLLVASSAYVTLLAGNTGEVLGATGQAIVVAPRHPVSGRVIDAAGAPVEGARVEMTPPPGLLARFGRALDDASLHEAVAMTDADGRFALATAPRLDGATLEVTSPGYEPHSEPQPVDADAMRDVQLIRASNVLAGQVVDDAGRPVSDAQVSAMLVTTHSDPYGGFRFHFTDDELRELEAAQDGPALTLTAIRAGTIPGRATVPLPGDARPWRAEGILLQLGGPSLTLSGRVEDEDGTPLRDVAVWIADPTVFARHPGSGTAPSAGADELDDLQSGPRSGLPDPVLVLEDLLSDEPRGLWARQKTNDLGQFTLTGLEDRDYVIAAMNTGTLQGTASGSIRAGRTDVLLTLDTRQLWSHVSGSVQARDGTPLPGVRIQVRRRVLSLPDTTTSSIGRSVLTDEQGRFRLEGVPREGTYLWVDGSDVLATAWGEDTPLGSLSAPAVEGLLISVPLRLELQVQLDDPGSADQLRVLDATGDTLPLNTYRFDRRRLRAGVEIIDGRSEVVAVTDDAALAELLRNGRVVRRIPLSLVRGEVTLLR